VSAKLHETNCTVSPAKHAEPINTQHATMIETKVFMLFPLAKAGAG